jgi:hypothetical protein
LRHARQTERRARRAREKREGIVVLIVMLVLFMATGTAVFAIQSSQYEQRASTSLGESNWARGVAECTAMAGLAHAEDTNALQPSLSAQWRMAGSALAPYSQKYGMPGPSAGLAAPPASPDLAGSVLLMDAPVAATPPPTTNTLVNGLAAFLPSNDRSRDSPTYPLFRNHDSQLLSRPGLRFLRAHWLQERLNPALATTAGGVPSTVSSARTRTVITAFAEVNVWGDSMDSGGARGLHELDAVARGYIDTITPSTP